MLAGAVCFYSQHTETGTPRNPPVASCWPSLRGAVIKTYRYGKPQGWEAAGVETEPRLAACHAWVTVLHRPQATSHSNMRRVSA